eukprot:gene17986-19783_t
MAPCMQSGQLLQIPFVLNDLTSAAFLHFDKLRNLYFDDKERPIFISALWVSYIEGHILRLPCKEVGEFTITKDNFELQGSVVASFTNLQDFECEDKCRLNPKCKSINMEKEGSKSCQLNSVSISEKITARNALVAKTGWVYKTTDYNSTLIGENCQLEKPCPFNHVCQDLCSCQGFECFPISDCMDFRRRNVTTSDVYRIIPNVSPAMPMQHREVANKVYAYYSTFEIGSESDGYRLKIGGYSGNAGDSLAYHNEMKFSTKDITIYGTCGVTYKSGWWFNACFYSNLNNIFPTSPTGTGTSQYISWKTIKNKPIFISALWVSYIEGHILRLPCKEVGEFTVAKDNFELQGSVVATFTNLQDFECEDKCRLNPKCKSINMEKEGSKSCQLNSVSTSETITAGNALVAKTGWVYKTTDYNSTLIGENCQLEKPCPFYQVCRDLCSCQGYECLTPKDCMDIQRRNATTSADYWIIPDASPTMPMQHREVANKVYAYYSTFEIGSESDGYRLKIDGYSGNAGDSLASHNAMKFSTPDRDNDKNGNDNCAMKFVFISALWVSYIEGHILRLPCKEVGEFTITKDNFELQGSVVASFTNLQDFECEDKCRLNPKCKSINMEKEGSKSCQLNSVSTSEKITAGNALVAKTGWVYKTTDYNSTLIGENCQLEKPCPFYQVCRDLCSCQGYECLTPKDCMDIQRRNATTNSDYLIIPDASPTMPMQHREVANKVYAYYSTFEIGRESDGYRLKIGGYSGNAGNSLANENDMKFSTSDRDNDKNGNGNCAVNYKSGWWFNSCFHSNLNNPYPTSPTGTNTKFFTTWWAIKKEHGNIVFSEMKLRYISN